MNLDKSTWEKVKLEDVAFEYSKRVDKPSESDFDRFVGSANIGRFDFKIKSWENTADVESPMKQFDIDDYLLVRRSLYASDFRERAPKADFAGICSGDILTIKENPKKIVKGFLIGVLNSPLLWKYIVANASGSITRRIKWKELSQYEFLLPPKDQQRKLTALFWAVDEVVNCNSNLKDRVLKVFNTTQEYYFFKETAERNFQEKQVLDISPLQRGFDLPEQDLVLGNYPVAYSNGIRKYHKEYKIKGPGVFTGRSGTIGNVFYTESDYWPHNTTLWVSDFKNNHPKYIFYLFSALHLEKLSAGTGVPTLNRNDVHKLKLRIHPISDQKGVVDILDGIMLKIKSIESLFNISNALKTKLINQIFS